MGIKNTKVVNEQESSFERAQKHVQDLKGWYNHLLVYVVVNSAYLLFYFGLFDRGAISSYIPWWSPVIMLVAWGISVGIHFIVVNKGNFINRSYKNWENRKIKEFLEREEAKQADINKWE